MYETPGDLLREILDGEDSFLDWMVVVFKGTEIRFVGG